jgi:hypothetical protein
MISLWVTYNQLLLTADEPPSLRIRLLVRQKLPMAAYDGNRLYDRMRL